MAEDRAPTALEVAVSRVGDRWTLLVIEALLDGPRRFSELAEDVHGIAPNILTHRLRHLERETLLIAREYSERPRRFVYELTQSGRELAGALRLLAEWGSRDPDAPETPRHEVCGTPLEARWYCPTCEEVVEGDVGDELELI